MARSVRDSRKRLKGLGLPVELCVKLEQYAGVKPGEKPDFFQKVKISEFVIDQLNKALSDIVLSPENVAFVEQEINQNHDIRPTPKKAKPKLKAKA